MISWFNPSSTVCYLHQHAILPGQAISAGNSYITRLLTGLVNATTAVATLLILCCQSAVAQLPKLYTQAEQAMLEATQYMDKEVSNRGGYVWYYLPDMSRQWGEMEAYKSMVWVQDGGTVSVGHMLLDAYHATGNEYFYNTACRAADALVKGQSKYGGWNYMIDFAGEKSLKKWYATIGANGWRLEEFQHYYGNDTYDDDVTSDAARFLLRMYLEKKDSKYQAALGKAIQFVLKSQYDNGGWPQRYPLMSRYKQAGKPDYTSYHTFNDDVIWENVKFLMQCYLSLGDSQLLQPIYKGMNFYLLSQKPCGAWGQQYTMQMQVAGARTFEPAAYLPRETYENAFLLIQFYRLTGDKKFLKAVPAAISWLEKVALPTDKQQGRFSHALFVDTATHQPIYVHRKGSNVVFGYYYTNNNDTLLLSHMRGKNFLDINRLKEEYQKATTQQPGGSTKPYLLHPASVNSKALTNNMFSLNQNELQHMPDTTLISKIINSLDNKGRWLTRHVMISHPYTGKGTRTEPTDAYASTSVGDETDTSPYRDESEQLYISTPLFIQNMKALIQYLTAVSKNQLPIK